MSASLMSDTKWRKVFAVLQRPEFGITQVWFKFVDAEEEKPARVGVGLYPPHPFIDTLEFGPVELVAIEWVRIQNGQAKNAISALKEIGEFKFATRSDGVRIIGHQAYA